MMDIDEQYLELAEEYDQTLDQLIIERDRLLLENESLDDKLQEQLCTVGSLLEENAKLIAERDELIHDRDMLKMCADHYEDELKRMHAERDSEKYELELHRADYKAIKSAGFESPGELLSAYNHHIAEREQWMKQEPVGKTERYFDEQRGYEWRVIFDKDEHLIEGMSVYVNPFANDEVFRLRNGISEIVKTVKPLSNFDEYQVLAMSPTQLIDHVNKLLVHPLPAQQIPEVTLPEKKPVPVPDISIQAWDSQDFENSAYNNAIDDMAEILINQGYAIRKPTKM